MRIAAAAVLAAVLSAPPLFAQNRTDECGELVLHNGKIVTLDSRNAIASSVTIRNGVIAAVGTGRGIPRHTACATVIDVRGRTVLPGLIDNHAHIIAVGLRPGYDTRLDRAFSIAEVQQALQARSKTVPPGAFVTAIGGWHTNQLRERRLPTAAELDAAVPNHPVFVALAFAGPASTNRLGKAVFESKGVSVGADGGMTAGAQTIAAMNALRATQTFEDQKRGMLDALNYAARLGLTTHMDNAGGWPPGVEGAEGIAVLGSGGSNEMHPFTSYEPLLALHREGKLPVRMRIFFASRDLTPDLTFLKQRLNNQFREFGDDWMKVSGIGEWITSGPFTEPPPIYEAAVRLVAERGWSYQQHTAGPADGRAMTAVWEKVNASIPLAPLRWNLAHVPGIDPQTVDRLKKMGVGVGVGGNRYLAGTAATPGPPFRMIVNSGIPTGYGVDGGNISPNSPWVHVHYMVTGKNAAGEVIEPGQQITRMEALRLFGSANAWFTKEENRLGSIEVGKLGDIAVLSDDVLDPAKVSDEALKRVSSVLTIVGGRIVHDAGIFRRGQGD
jgi:predicted amidohydrolase YtcJ